MKSIFIYIILLGIITACNQSDKRTTNLQKSLAVNENPIISIEPSENVNLEDYWEEATAIQTEAEQILNEAKKSRCQEADYFAQAAISLSKQTTESHDFSEAEHLTGEASEMVQNAETALVQCQEQTEQISY